MTMRFIGTRSEVGGTKLDRFGRAFEIPDKDVQDLVTGPDSKLPALPAAEFDKIGFTSQELEKYQWPSTHADAPASFLAKKSTALKRLHDIRTKTESEVKE